MNSPNCYQKGNVLTSKETVTLKWPHQVSRDLKTPVLFFIRHFLLFLATGWKFRTAKRLLLTSSKLLLY